MGYRECFALQQRVNSLVAEEKLPNCLLSVEHPPTYTLGANFHAENLPLPASEYEKLGVAIETTDRGGDITYHGPNQLVQYPILNLKHFGQDLHRYLRDLEESVIVGLRAWGIEGKRFPPHTGVWVGERKICAIGIKVRKWTSMHGIALNCNNDLSPFDWIVPCGIKGYSVTNLSKELGAEVSWDDARVQMNRSFTEVFGLEWQEVPKEQLFLELDRLETDGIGNFPEAARSE